MRADLDLLDQAANRGDGKILQPAGDPALVGDLAVGDGPLAGSVLVETLKHVTARLLQVTVGDPGRRFGHEDRLASLDDEGDVLDGHAFREVGVVAEQSVAVADREDPVDEFPTRAFSGGLLHLVCRATCSKYHFGIRSRKLSL